MFFSILLTLVAFANCEWSQPVRLGSYSGSYLPEASGVTSNGKDLYFVNDTEGDGSLYSFSTSAGMKKISLNWNPLNLEAISYGKCGDSHCFYLADIGDNDSNRDHVSILAVEENTYKKISEWKFSYEDGPQNVEAFVVDGNGDFFFLSKSDKKAGGEAKLYSFSSRTSQNAEAKKIGSVRLDSPVTDMAISPNGSRIAILTSKGAMEIPFAEFKLGDFRSKESLPIEVLKKQESISYFGEKTLVWSTEAKKLSEVPILKMSCVSGEE